MDPKRKYHLLLELIAARRRVAVAFSGGVDSSFLCHAALAIIVAGPTLAARDR